MVWRLGIVLLLTGCLSACGSLAPIESRDQGPQVEQHVVVRGENLIRIAWRYGLDYRDIAAWNRLDSPDRILAGQRLRLTPPPDWQGAPPRATARPPSQPAVTSQPTVARTDTPQVAPGRGSGNWDWPTEGRLVKRFNPAELGGKGIQIGGQPGQPVRAASSGQVVYKGSGLRGYGQLIIVKHSDSLLSAYGYLGRMLVDEGDRVSKGQAIAELGNDNNPPALHFEVRENGKPVDPLRFLPS